MSKHLAELCTLLVRETYGELPSRILSTLLLHGRLALLPLIHHSSLRPDFVKHGLSVLVQQRLVYHHTSSSDDQTYYQVHVRNTYDIVRYGKITALVKDRIGEESIELVSLLERNGYASPSELLSDNIKQEAQPCQLGTQEHVNGHSMVNGVGKHNTHGNESRGTKRKRTRTEICNALFDSRYVVEVSEHDFVPPADFHDAVAEHVKNVNYKGEVKGKNQTAEYLMKVLKRKREWLDDNVATVERLEEGVRFEKQLAQSHNSRKRAGSPEINGGSVAELQLDGTSESQPNKKRRTDESNAVEIFETINDTKPDLSSRFPSNSVSQIPAFRINPEKIDVSFRSLRLQELATRHLGDTVGQVYGALLRRLEHNIPRCHDEYTEAKKAKKTTSDEEGEDVGYDSDDEDGAATSYEIEITLDSSVDVYSTFTGDKQAKVKIESVQENEVGHAELDDEELVNRDHGRQTNDKTASSLKRAKRVNAINQHLQLAAEHYLHFCSRAIGRGQMAWSINFHELTRSLVQHEIEAVVTSRFGALATRVVRMLHSKGKLDEKQLSSVGLIRQKDLRLVLTQMQEAGYVDTQEVPRDNSRQPSRTIYLWFYDYDRCRTLILNDTYKSMTRLLQRAKVEQEKVQSVLDKASRTDVQGQEDKYLAPAEQQALAEWRNTEEQLLAQLSRQDDLVGLLRDYLPVKS